MKTVHTFELAATTRAVDVAAIVAALASECAPATVRNLGPVGGSRQWLISVRAARTAWSRRGWAAEVTNFEAKAQAIARACASEAGGFCSWVEDEAGKVVRGSSY